MSQWRRFRPSRVTKSGMSRFIAVSGLRPETIRSGGATRPASSPPSWTMWCPTSRSSIALAKN